MPQVTLYLDDETDALARASAAAAGLSYSRWLGELIRSSSDWPPEIRRLVGSAPDFPLREDLGETKGVDIPRVALED
jgi:hypothetical protein